MPILGTTSSPAKNFIGSFESIQTVTVTSNTASITFSSIPSIYKDLQIRMITKTNSFSVPGLRIRFNSDTATNYSQHNLLGNGSSAFSQSTINATNISTIGPGAGNQGANMVGANIIDILDYASTVKNKTIRVLAGNDFNAAGCNVGMTSGLWRNSSTAISSIYMETDTLFVGNSYFALYGIKGQ